MRLVHTPLVILNQEIMFASDINKMVTTCKSLIIREYSNIFMVIKKHTSIPILSFDHILYKIENWIHVGTNNFTYTFSTTI